MAYVLRSARHRLAAVLLLALGAAACDDLAVGSKARLRVTPTELVYRGALPRAEPYELRIKVENVGSADLSVGPMRVEGDPQFALASDTPATLRLRPATFYEVKVLYTAIDANVHNAVFRLEAGDTEQPRASVPMRSETLAPRLVATDCIAPLPPPVVNTGDGGVLRTDGGVADGGSASASDGGSAPPTDGGARADGGTAPACEGATDDLLIDFGERAPGQCRDAEVRIENTGVAELVVSAPVFQAGSSPAFSVAPRGDGGPGEVRLAPVREDGTTSETRLSLRFCPTAVGMFTGSLLIQSNDTTRSEVVVQLRGRSRFPHCTYADRLVQPSTTKADVLFVVDNSGSMSDNQMNLRTNFNALAEYMQRQSVDYQIGVITTDRATLIGSPAIIYVGDPDPTAEFDRNANVGTSGSSTERGLEMAKQALSAPNVTGANAGFMRPDASLEVVIVSDEDDQSTGSPDSFAAFFLGLKDRSRGLTSRVSAIAGDVPGGCTASSGNAVAGTRYKAAVTATGGTYGSICSASFAGTLTLIGQSLGPQRDLRLRVPVDREFPILVRTYVTEAACLADTDFTGGRLLTENASDGFTFNVTTNTVTFAMIPPRGSCARIQYEAPCGR